MSLQPGINPFEASSMEEDRKRLERTMLMRKFRQGMEERANLYNEMKKRTGFDGSRSLGEVTRERTNTPLKPGMIDYEAMMKKREGMKTMEVRDQNPGIPNMGGFDPGDLMAAPKLRQDATMNQANMVSSPYFKANEKAAEKTNPMNAASQEPGRSFLMKFIGK